MSTVAFTEGKKLTGGGGSKTIQSTKNKPPCERVGRNLQLVKRTGVGKTKGRTPGTGTKHD